MNPVWVKTWVRRENAGLTEILTRIAFSGSLLRLLRFSPLFSPVLAVFTATKASGLCQGARTLWSYWPDLNRRPADYERSYLDFSLAAHGFSGLLPRLSRKHQQVNYPVDAFSSARKRCFCGQAMGQKSFSLLPYQSIARVVLIAINVDGVLVDYFKTKQCTCVFRIFFIIKQIISIFDSIVFSKIHSR